MDPLMTLLTLMTSIFCFLLFVRLAWVRSGARRSSKGPRKTVPEASGSLPIIGHLHLLAGSQVTHRLLGSMADKFGPIFTIKVGGTRVLVVSNAEMAKECLTTNDKIFASRPKSMASELIGYNYAMFSIAPYGSYWRDIRKIIVLELSSQRRVQLLEHTRTSEVKASIIDMYTNWMRNKGSSDTVKVDMKQWFGNLTVNMTTRMLFGNRFSTTEQFKKAVNSGIELFSVFVPSDVIPCLRWLDLGGYEKEMKHIANLTDVVIKDWLEMHRKEVNSTQQLDEGKDQGFMAALLSRIQDDLNVDLYGFSIDAIMKATCLAIYGAATDATSATLTWALALLVNNPRVLKKCQEELEIHVGRERMVKESDLPNLVYLQAVIKETMRLYPATPLAIPHESTEDCIVGGYTVPKGTRLLVNIWKIQHDPKIWTYPFEFIPERFLTSKKDIDVKGHHFELLPFGSGRRMCVGISFALKSVPLILASLIHGFEFQNPSSEPTDMTECRGLTNLKATPPEVLVAPRLLADLDGQLSPPFLIGCP